MLDRLIALGNDLGLLAEEYDVRAGRQVGNFPQAFSHVSLVNAAYNLSGHPGMEQQLVADEGLLRSAGRRFGRAGSMHGLARVRPPRSTSGHAAILPETKPKKKRGRVR
jgi:Glycosyl hydrolases family 15